MPTYTVAGTNRQVGALGLHETFELTLDAEDHDAACEAARQARYAENFEHVHIWAAVPVTSIKAQAEAIADAYWRARREPGGTTEVDGQIVQSEKCKQLWRDMGALTEGAIKANRATLLRNGVPEQIVNATASQDDIRIDVQRMCLRWTGFLLDDFAPERLDQMISPPLRTVDEWGQGAARWVWVNEDERLIVTYCEGDTSVQRYFSLGAYNAAYQSAAIFYREH